MANCSNASMEPALARAAFCAIAFTAELDSVSRANVPSPLVARRIGLKVEEISSIAALIFLADFLHSAIQWKTQFNTDIVLIGADICRTDQREQILVVGLRQLHEGDQALRELL